ncbi:GIY-YIG nuclease family protein [Mesorhizobium sp. A556]
MTGYVYMTASQKRGAIYIGVTNDLGRRSTRREAGGSSRFTSRYGVQRLVLYEEHFDMRDGNGRSTWPKSQPDWYELFRGLGC